MPPPLLVRKMLRPRGMGKGAMSACSCGSQDSSSLKAASIEAPPAKAMMRTGMPAIVRSWYSVSAAGARANMMV